MILALSSLLCDSASPAQAGSHPSSHHGTLCYSLKRLCQAFLVGLLGSSKLKELRSTSWRSNLAAGKLQWCV